MAWLIAATHSAVGQVIFVFLTTAPIAAFGFKHSIAGAIDAFYRATIGDAPWNTMLLGFEVPTILGNIVGGVVLVALVNHGQVKRRKSDRAHAQRVNSESRRFIA
jgi:formate/nitrite transporter FocA (FNT family)